MSKDLPEGCKKEKPAGITGVTLSYRQLKADDAGLDQAFANGLAEMDADVETGRQSSVESLKTFLAGPQNLYVVAFADGEVAGRAFGYVQDHPRGNRFIYIMEVDTLKQFRRKGVARGLMEEVKKMATDLGAEELWLTTDHDNYTAIALYRSIGPFEDQQEQLFSYKTGGK